MRDRFRHAAIAGHRIALAEWGILVRNGPAVAGAGLSAIGVLLLQSPLGALVRLPLDMFVRERRHHAERAQADELAALERGALSFVARAAREGLVESSIRGLDFEALTAARDANMGDPTFMPYLPSWSPDAIVERGEAALTISVKWSEFAQLLRDHATHFSGVIGPYSASLPPHARSVIDVILKASERAADGAAAAASEAYELRGGDMTRKLTAEQVAQREAAFVDARGLFFGGLQWMIGRVEELERIAGSDTSA
jgi:hypothetical protein